ncbi:MAG TPA: uroporphyrinogen-III C-methyltransferase [Candidatus Corynebacterium avicola]|uniref:uroporphyrinogen-III C-methyltransferase n=1 Tax=Candidatus Corynebacterium avicola TaxID=2838527 RepID=A0A9D1UKE8_9CORY|nr:uroporphyrinogen-III C-methyltransferase [Candidatus Corynebacterium avicola]
MSLVLTGVPVLVVDGPEADVTAELLRDQGAVPVAWGDIATRIGLVRIPAGTEAQAAEDALAWAHRNGIPVDDRRGRTSPVSAVGASADTSTGSVTLVGGGPGDADLVTVAGVRAIEAADVILADHLGAITLADEAAERGAEVIDVAKIPYSRQVSQERINEIILEKARAGLNVVRLKGGDPFIFGRGHEEVTACAEAGIPVTVIPGVTSVTSAPAAAGVSLTHRGVNHDVTVVSGHLPPGHEKSLVNWDALAQMTGTLVLIMAVRNAGAIATELIAKGQDAATPVVVIENASTDKQRVTGASLETLGETIEREGLGSPAIIVIGEAAARR